MAHRKSPARLRKASRAAHFTALSRQNAPPVHQSLSWQTLASLEAAITGKVVVPGDPDYNKDR